MKENILERRWVIHYFKKLFHHPAFIEDEKATTYLVNAACAIYPDELYAEIQEAFKRDRVDTWYINMNGINEMVALGKEAALERELYKNPHMTLIDDVIVKLKWWACFQEKTHDPLSSMQDEVKYDNLTWRNDPEVSITYRRDTPKVGRNDPYPCGSGKKHKKCCLMQAVH